MGINGVTILQMIKVHTATAHAHKVMGVSMSLMGHAVEGQDSNLISNSNNTEELEYNCDQSIHQSTDLLRFRKALW